MYLRIGLYSLLFSFLFLIAIVGCGGNGSEGITSSGTGKISIQLTDGPGEYQAVYVTIEEVQIHESGGGWRLISSPHKTYDLLALRNGIRTPLGLKELPTGSYTQIRLLLSSVSDGGTNLLGNVHRHGNYVILNDDTIRELKVPSGMQSGIKLIGDFTITADKTTIITLDFDADKSVVEAGESGQWLLKPVIKTIIEEEHENVVMLRGSVKDPSGGAIEGAKVSLQETSDSNISIEAVSYSDLNGSYRLRVDPREYILVAYKGGYLPFADDMNLSAEENRTFDITLNEALRRGTLTLRTTGDYTEESAKVSIEQNLSGLRYEVMGFNISSGFDGLITLPEGNYTGIARLDENRTQMKDINITNGGTVDWTVSF